MATYIYTQFQVNGNVNAYGGIFIGQYGADPQDSANALTVYLDEELTQPVSGFNISLDFNGQPLVEGSRVNLYIDEPHSFNAIDRDGAELFKDWLNIDNPVSAIIAQDWVKTLTPLSPNVTVESDGQGNYTIDAAALGGGDVFQGGDNEFTGNNSFQGEIGVWDYTLNTTSSTINPTTDFILDVPCTTAGTYEFEFSTKLESVVSTDVFNIFIAASRGIADFAGLFADLSYYQANGVTVNSIMSYTDATSPSLAITPTPDLSNATIAARGQLVFAADAANALQIRIQKTLGGSANSIGYSLKFRKITDENVNVI